MKKVLIINASSKMKDSYSRKLADQFEKLWLSEKPNDQIMYRDIGKYPIPHLSEEWISGTFKHEDIRTTAEKEALMFSDLLVEELLESDTIVIAAPMYNWSIPSVLKAYIDHIIRTNKTIALDAAKPENPYIGLVKNKQAYLILVRGGGGYEKGEFLDYLEFHYSYLSAILKTIGIKDVYPITMNLSAMGDKIAEESYQNTLENMSRIIKK